MKKIKLTQGKFTLISDIDYAYLNQWKWYYLNGYAVRGHKAIWMHRVILERMGFKNFKQTDHINRVKSDNRRSNLRPATISQNQQNRAAPINNTSGVKGVYWNKKDKKWMARIQIKGEEKYLGNYSTLQEAHIAYIEAAKQYFGEFYTVGD